MDKPSSLKNKMVTVFRQYGREGLTTRLFENMSQWRKDIIEKRIVLADGEVPVLGSAESPIRWLLLTTDRLVWRLGDRTLAVPLREIRGADVDTQTVEAMEGPKEQWRHLQVVTTADQRQSVEVEEGPPFFGLWHVLTFLGRIHNGLRKGSAEKKPG